MVAYLGLCGYFGAADTDEPPTKAPPVRTHDIYADKSRREDTGFGYTTHDTISFDTLRKMPDDQLARLNKSFTKG